MSIRPRSKKMRREACILGMGSFGYFLHAIILDAVKKISLRCKMQWGVSF